MTLEVLNLELDNGELLLEYIRRSDHTVAELAAELGIDRATLYRKIKDPPDNFSVKEAYALSGLLGLSQIDFRTVFICP